MKMLKQIRFLLALVAVLLFLVLLSLPHATDRTSAPSLVPQLLAQTAQPNPDVLFFPVGNQDVRKFVFWDRRSNQIHVYSGNGKYEETWQFGSAGQDMKKQ